MRDSEENQTARRASPDVRSQRGTEVESTGRSVVFMYLAVILVLGGIALVRVPPADIPQVLTALRNLL